MLVSVSNAVVRALLAPTCAACALPLDAPLDGAICPSCAGGIHHITPPICIRCGDLLSAYMEEALCPRCRHDLPAVSLARSVGIYDGTLRDMVHALKYRQRRMIAPWLSARMRQSGAEVLAGADAVVPVPLHIWRHSRRGFNQADDLAMGLGLPVWRALRRRRGGPPQARLPASARHANASGAYALAWRERLRRRVRGAVIVLVDDVMTTGATLNACATVLADAGAADVRALTAARAVAARPQPRPQTPRLSTARR